MPAARHIHPIGLSGRLEAIRVPTKGIMRKGNRKTNTMLRPPVPQLEGGSTFRVKKYNTTVATNMPTERAPSDQASQAARLIALSPRLRSFVPTVTPPLYSNTVCQALRRTLRQSFCERRRTQPLKALLLRR